MLITKQTVADKITAYLQHKIGVDDLVDWAESTMMDAEFAVSLRNPNHSQEQTIRDALHLVAKKEECSPTAVALAWLLRHPAGIVPIIGSTNPEHIRDAAKAVDLTLSREEWYRLMTSAIGQPLP
jgi:predicted oxidoreductase